MLLLLLLMMMITMTMMMMMIDDDLSGQVTQCEARCHLCLARRVVK